MNIFSNNSLTFECNSCECNFTLEKYEAIILTLIDADEEIVEDKVFDNVIIEKVNGIYQLNAEKHHETGIFALVSWIHAEECDTCVEII